ncbi:MAG: rod shape-determining protein MreC [Rhodospirillales bacterium]
MKERPRQIFRVEAPIRTLAQRFLYLGLVGAAFALMLLGKADVLLMDRMRAHVTDAVAPILDFASRPVASAKEMVGEARAMIALKAENDRLREDRARLLQWQAVARKLEAENKALKGLLNFKPGPEASYLTARVIADAGGAFAHSIVLNIGERDGVENGQAIVTGEGLVGRVAIVGSRSARVLLLTDLNSRIPVLVESTRTRAILAGNNTDQPRLIHLPPNARVPQGDRIVTSGHAGVFPPGIPIGVVANVGDGGITVQPFAKRNALEYVQIVNYKLDGILRRPKKAERAGETAP